MSRAHDQVILLAGATAINGQHVKLAERRSGFAVLQDQFPLLRPFTFEDYLRECRDPGDVARRLGIGGVE